MCSRFNSRFPPNSGIKTPGGRRFSPSPGLPVAVPAGSPPWGWSGLPPTFGSPGHYCRSFLTQKARGFSLMLVRQEYNMSAGTARARASGS